ncbi:MAG: AraC family transcriptional regulator [bacterium]|nr:AraC family transcriptional regulator [bacterium]
MIENKLPHYSFKGLGLENQMANIANLNGPSLYNYEEIHTRDFYNLSIFKKGGSFHFIDFQRREIKDFSVHLISKNSIYRSEKCACTDGLSILISHLYLEQLQRFDSGIDYINFFDRSRIINFNSDLNAFNYFFNELIANQINSSNFLNTLASFLSKLITFKNENIIETPNSLVDNLRDFINNHYQNRRCIRGFEETNNFTEVTLRRKIKNLTGKTPLQHLHDKIHLESKSLICNSFKSIKEIAFELGFGNESYFCKQFKNYEKVTALEFRKSTKSTINGSKSTI